jgi:hypothetical protein
MFDVLLRTGLDEESNYITWVITRFITSIVNDYVYSHIRFVVVVVSKHI